MKGHWTICPGPQPDTIFQRQNLLYFLCKCQNRQPSTLPSRRRGRTARGLAQDYLGAKKKRKALFSSPFLPTLFRPEGWKKKNPVGKGKGDSTILFSFLCLAFVGGGAWGSPLLHVFKRGLIPHLWGAAGTRLPGNSALGRGVAASWREARRGRWEEEAKGPRSCPFKLRKAQGGREERERR